MSNDSAIAPVLLLALAVALAALLSFITCRALLRSSVHARLPRAVRCALLWAVATAIFWFAPLPIMRSLADTLDLLLLVPAAGLRGLIYGGGFSLLSRFGRITGKWHERAAVGAILGMALAFLAGLSLHEFLSGWGGPGGGSYRRPGVLDASLYFAWLAPLFALAGVITPRSALVPDTRQPS